MSKELVSKQDVDSTHESFLYMNVKLLMLMSSMPNALRYTSLYVISICLNSKSRCYYAAHANTSDYIGVSTSTIRRALAWMLDHEWLSGGSRGLGKACKYVINPKFYDLINSQKLRKSEKQALIESRHQREIAEHSRRVRAFYKQSPEERKGKKVPKLELPGYSDSADDFIEDTTNTVKPKAKVVKDKDQKHKNGSSKTLRILRGDVDKKPSGVDNNMSYRKRMRLEFKNTSTQQLCAKYANTSSSVNGSLFKQLPESIQVKIIEAVKNDDLAPGNIYVNIAKDYGMPVRNPRK